METIINYLKVKYLINLIFEESNLRKLSNL